MSMKDILSKAKGMERAKLKSYGAKSGDIKDSSCKYTTKRAFGGRVHKQAGGSVGEDEMDIGPIGGKKPGQDLSKKPRGNVSITINAGGAKPVDAAGAPMPPPAMPLPPPPPAMAGGPPGLPPGMLPPGPPPGMMIPPPGPPGMPPPRPFKAGGRISNLGKYAHGGKIKDDNDADDKPAKKQMGGPMGAPSMGPRPPMMPPMGAPSMGPRPPMMPPMGAPSMGPRPPMMPPMGAPSMGPRPPMMPPMGAPSMGPRPPMMPPMGAPSMAAKKAGMGGMGAKPFASGGHVHLTAGSCSGEGREEKIAWEKKHKGR